MNWKCNNCQQIFEVASESSIRFCPNCGAKINFEETLQSENNIQPEKSICPVCSTEIQATDEKIICPDCKIAYHKDCWKDLVGCRFVVDFLDVFESDLKELDERAKG